MLNVSVVDVNLSFDRMDLPYWLGNKFRGGFGQHLRRAICDDKHKDCKTCLEKGACLFYALYENKNSLKGYAAPPKGLVMIPPFFGKPLHVNNGTLKLKVLFFGEYSKYLPHLVLGLRLLGNKGLGRSKFSIAGIECGLTHKSLLKQGTLLLDNWQSLDIKDISKTIPKKFRVEFRTPLMIKNSDFPPSLDLLVKLIRRRTISYVNNYGKGKVPEIRASGNIVSYDRHTHNLMCKSSRHGLLSMRAHTGKVTYELKRTSKRLSWLLSVGELIGAGPKPGYGMGHYKIYFDE